MPKPLLGYLWMYTRVQKLSGVRVPKVMKANAGNVFAPRKMVTLVSRWISEKIE